VCYAPAGSCPIVALILIAPGKLSCIFAYYIHLIINTDLQDDLNITGRCHIIVQQINDVFFYFSKLNAVVKLKLLYSFLYCFYGNEV
jgi:hypothetical protein